MSVDIVTIQNEKPFDTVAAQAELDALRKDVRLRQLEAVHEHDASQDAGRSMAAVAYVVAAFIVFILGACAGAAGLAWLAQRLGPVR